MVEVTNPELQLAFDFVQYTNRNVFLTGKAGTGKTTFLHRLKTLSPKRMIVVAPTGVAAINAGGVTIHSFFQMPFGPIIPTGQSNNAPFAGQEQSSASVRKFSREKINIIRSLDLLVIDEISMVRADLLDGIDEVLRRYKNRSKPFGGVQLLMIGDLHQLAPVVKDDEWSLLREYYSTPFFFGSIALRQTNYVSIELKHIYRQSDREFIDLLNHVRDNMITDEVLNTLNSRYIPNFALEAEEGYITLTTHNHQAQSINDAKLTKLPSKEFVFKASVEGEFPEYSYPTESQLVLKPGAQVMFVKNDSSFEKLFYNGKIGTITRIEDKSIFVKCPTDTFEIEVSIAEWNNYKYSINESTQEIEETSIGKFMQYPLKLAWAITIHKSQGLTFEKAIIDAKSSFAFGQVYVALSRCKTFEGMVLNSKLAHSSVKTDGTILSVTRSIEENVPTQQQLAEAKNAYQLSLVYDLFDFDILRRRLDYLLKQIRDNQSSLQPNFIDTPQNALTVVSNQLIGVWAKFKAEVDYLYAQNGDIEGNGALQTRIMKGCDYFMRLFQQAPLSLLPDLAAETDNKAVAKAVNDAIARLNQELKVKKACLAESTKGFFTKEYLEARAKASIEKAETPKRSRASKFEGTGTGAGNEAFKLIKAWRDAKAEELDLPVYMVIPQKTLISLAQLLPTTYADLISIKGMGKKKAAQFGAELIDIIRDYRIDNSMPVNDTEAELPMETPAKQKVDTKRVSFDLFTEGLTVEQIAHHRSLTVNTIEGHLADFVATGEIPITKLLPAAKVEQIVAYFTKSQTRHLLPAKEALGDSVTYGELKLVLKHLESQEIGE